LKNESNEWMDESNAWSQQWIILSIGGKQKEKWINQSKSNITTVFSLIIEPFQKWGWKLNDFVIVKFKFGTKS
jgi:hypothetical protein